MSELEHIIQPAKSGRASCKTCRKKIDKGVLRFGEAFVNTFSDSGRVSHRWHHMECAAKKHGKLLGPTLEKYEGDVPVANEEELKKLIAESATKAAKKPGAFPYADHAPTSRARCIICDDKIQKGDPRIAIEREIDTGAFVRKGAGYLHPHCVEEWIDEEGKDIDAFKESLKANTSILEGAELEAVLSELG